MDEGAYGCVYRPGIKCDGTVETSSKYISKIQKKKERTDNEPVIGKRIAERIKHSSRYFAPALSVCDAKVTKINKNELGKCKAIREKKTEDEFVSIKIKYVGKDNLEDNMGKHRKKDGGTLLLHMMDTHQYLVEAIAELEKEKIVHHDIKSNNVMYSDSQNVPIIIDFGVSFQLKDLYKEDMLQDIFFTAYEKYPPWCLEITLISAIIKVPKWETEKVDMEALQAHLSVFIDENPIMILVGKQQSTKTRWKMFMQTSFENENGKTVVNKLLETWNTWDLYSVHVMYLSFIHHLLKKEHVCVRPYIKYITSQILLLPGERDDPKTTIGKMESLRGEIKKSDFVDFVREEGLL